MRTSKLGSNLRVIKAVAKKEWLCLIRYPGWYMPIILSPLLFIFPYLFAGLTFSGPSGAGMEGFERRTGMTDPISFVIIGSSLWIWFNGLLWDVGNTIRGEQLQGTLEGLWATPVNRLVLTIGVGATHVFINLLQVGVVVIEAWLFFRFSFHGDILLVGVIILMSCVALYGLGFIYSGLVILFKEATALTNIIGAAMLALCGVTYSISVLPVWVNWIAKCIPLTWSIDLLRLVLIKGYSIDQISSGMVVLFCFAIISPVVGYQLFKVMEKKARVKGVIGVY